MKIDILTLFPGMFDGFLNESIIKRAIMNNKVTINVHNIRDFSTDPHKRDSANAESPFVLLIFPAGKDLHLPAQGATLYISPTKKEDIPHENEKTALPGTEPAAGSVPGRLRQR